MSNFYVPLDGTIQSSLLQASQPFGFTIGQETSLASISSFVLFIILAASGVAAIGRVLYALGLRVANSDNESKITDQKTLFSEKIKILDI